ncbi:YibE/F family protein [Halosquirtibacter xylanolyticus]|uniref:YibE/F family protein n=1 Tax=Halosquirtibacter xylanolyticus TaxID=3374599 RepID=UPI003749E7E1|nr:YibE/F family protein [Prolixibacteraceae bacterium]
MKILSTQKTKTYLFPLVIAILTTIIYLLPSPFDRETPPSERRVKAKVVSVKDDSIIENGIIKTGNQLLQIVVTEGRFKGDTIRANNQLIGRMEFDKLFEVGQKALVVLNLDEECSKIINANVIDHYRLNVEFWLMILFFVFLISFAGFIGVKAILSFAFTGVVIWKLMLPGFLLGYSPVFLSLFLVALITSVIILLVAGINKKGFVALSGAIVGVAVTAILSFFFGGLFNVHGAIKPFSETLLYSGFNHLDLTQIFLASIFISSSGAMMDISMDIAVSQHEIITIKPSITTKELIGAGFNIGRGVIGTMTTTLLLAYSGGFSALLMVFIAQGTPTINILNLNYVAGEILHTMIGSFGLVLVAPITAILGGIIYTRR